MCVFNKTLLSFCSTNNLLIFSHFASYCQGTIYVPEGGHSQLMGVNLRFGITWGVLDRISYLDPNRYHL